MRRALCEYPISCLFVYVSVTFCCQFIADDVLTVDENLCLLSFSSVDSTHTQIERKSPLIRCTSLLFAPLQEHIILCSVCVVRSITAKASHYISNAILLSDKNTHLLHILYRHCFRLPVWVCSTLVLAVLCMLYARAMLACVSLVAICLFQWFYYTAGETRLHISLGP